MKKITFIIFISIFIILASCGIASSSTQQDKKVVFAGSDKFAPYSFLPTRIISGINTQDELINISITSEKSEGFLIDLSEALSKVISPDIEVKLMPWEKCISEIKTGQVDGLMGTIVDKDHKYLIYSTPVAEIEYAIFTESSNSYVHSIESLEGTIVAVPKESYMLKNLIPDEKIKIIETNSVPEALKKLEDREVTAIIAEKNVALFYIQQGKIENIKISGPPVGPIFQYALAARKNRSGLIRKINHGLLILQEDGTLQRLKRKWFGLHFTAPFPWKRVLIVTGAITGTALLIMAFLWVISLHATVKAKTHQIQMISQKMAQSDKLAVLGKLAGQIAHELRTPLSIINNSVYLLRKEGSENADLFEKRLRVLEDKIKLSSNILESILSYSRVKAEIATTISVKVCLEEVIKDMEFPEYITKKVTFENENHLMVFMDFHQLYSVLRNIVLNSIQAMSGAGSITVKVYASDNNSMVTTEICDTGPGIEESAQNKIFNLFTPLALFNFSTSISLSK